jgi:hypothetical protein
MLAITLASAIAITLIALRTPELQNAPQESVTSGGNFARPVTESLPQATTAPERADARSHGADTPASTSKPDDVSTGSTSLEHDSAISCPEGYEARHTSTGECARTTPVPH